MSAATAAALYLAGSLLIAGSAALYSTHPQPAEASSQLCPIKPERVAAAYSAGLEDGSHGVTYTWQQP